MKNINKLLRKLYIKFSVFLIQIFFLHKMSLNSSKNKINDYKRKSIIDISGKKFTKQQINNYIEQGILPPITSDNPEDIHQLYRIIKNII